MKGTIRYYKVVKDKQGFLGQRYFAFSKKEHSVMQVCIENGDNNRGKSNCAGLYLIGRLTFLSNYLAMNYVELTTKKEYTEKFNEIVNKFSTVLIDNKNENND